MNDGGKLKRNFISIVIPAHNEEDVIAKAIDSVLSSTYKKYEIIVVNNGSTDRTRAIVERYVKKYPQKIRLLNFDLPPMKDFIRKRGPAFSRNRGAEVARGDILFFLDADEWMIRKTLENTINSFKKYGEIESIVGNRIIVIQKNWRKIFSYYWIFRKKFFNRKEKISYGGPFCPYIIKTKKFVELKGFNEAAFYQEDNALRIKMEKLKIPKLISSDIICYNDIGSHFRDFKRQCSNTAKSFLVYPFKSIGILIQIMMIFLTFPILYLTLLSAFLWRTGDIFVSIFSPFLWVIRRIIEFYYLIKLSI